MSKKKPEPIKPRTTWGQMLTKEELLGLLDRIEKKQLAKKRNVRRSQEV